MSAMGEFVLLGSMGLVIVTLFAILQAIEAQLNEFDEDEGDK